ncbi:hypothetical protein [Massilia sp. Root351]|jgi:hypothetical protein|uniref:hypothetical protein n=1 Tax=Massilia sp. Root351 TaxID=1736522 RepID=UPI0012F66456|nr:hypothetical protein [Massilia sp. Root351]
MPNSAPPARFDLPWKLALTHAFRAFMAFFFADLCAQIDWSGRPRFRDKELAGIGFGDAPDGMVAGWRPHAFRNQILGTVMGISFATAKLVDYADRSDALLASHKQAFMDKGWKKGLEKGA